MAPPGNKKKTCAVFGCFITSRINDKASFFSLPSDSSRRAQWLKLIQREDLSTRQSNNFCVCEFHFDSRSIKLNAKRRMLHRDALPTLHLPPPREHAQIEIDIEPMNLPIPLEIQNDGTATSNLPNPRENNVIEIEIDMTSSQAQDGETLTYEETLRLLSWRERTTREPEPT